MTNPIENNTGESQSRELLTHELFEAQVRKTPNHTALEYGSHSLTYAELDRRAQILADHLTAHGARPDDIIGLCVKRSEGMVISVLGILKSGAAYLPMESSFPDERLGYMLQNADARILVSDSETKEQVPAFGGTRLVLDHLEPLPEKNDLVKTPSATPKNLAYVVYTSGSTGSPKGVAVEHRSFTHVLFSVSRLLNIRANEVVLSVAPYGFDVALPDWFWALMFGGKLILVQGSVYHDPSKMIQAINSTYPTHLQATPTFWEMLLAQGSGWTPDMRIVSTGEPMGNPLREELRKRSSRVWNLYGPTETTVWSTACDLHEDTHPNSIGRPIDNTTIHIQNEAGQPATFEEKGELLIGGVGLARGYINDPSTTREKFCTITGFTPERLYKTGDLVRLNEDGTLEFLGRLDYQVKIRGFRIELGEIDAAIQKHPDINSSVTVLLQQDSGDKKIITYVVRRPRSKTRTWQYRDFLEKSLPHQMIPHGIEVLDKMPVNTNGKIDRSALPRPSMVRKELNTAYVEPEGQIQHELIRIWEDVLSIDGLGIDDNFFDVGGHSITGLKIINRVNNGFNINVDLASVFGLQTIRQFSQLITERLNKSG